MEEQVKLQNKWVWPDMISVNHVICRCDTPLGLQLIIANRNGESVVDQCNMLLLLLLVCLCCHGNQFTAVICTGFTKV